MEVGANSKLGAYSNKYGIATPPLVSANADLNFHTDDSAFYC